MIYTIIFSISVGFVMFAVGLFVGVKAEGNKHKEDEEC